MIDRETSEKLNEAILCFVKRYCCDEKTTMQIYVNPKFKKVKVSIVKNKKINLDVT